MRLSAFSSSSARSHGCGSDRGSAKGPTPTAFVAHVDNAWFPLIPGTTFVYRGVKDGEPSREVLRVTNRTKLIQGVRCTVVDDRLYLRGRLEERTSDWYAQDDKGNVWYFGEDTAELDEHGRVTSTEGSGRRVSTAPGRASTCPPSRRSASPSRRSSTQAKPRITSRSSTSQPRSRVPYTSSKEALLTEEWTPLEPGVLDHKFYVRGIGTVKEQTVKGGDELNELVSVTASPRASARP